MSDLTTKAAEIRARLKTAIELGDRNGVRGKRPENIYNAADDALALIEQQAAELAEARAGTELLAKQIAEIEAEHQADFAKLTTAESERDELLREKERLEGERDEAREALIECEGYFDNRADADCDQDGFVPNKEMRLLAVVREAIASTSQDSDRNLADAHSKSPDPSSQPERIAVLEAARGTVLAWEALPGGNYYGIRAVQEWLNDRMAPAIGKLRAALAPLGEE